MPGALITVRFRRNTAIVLGTLVALFLGTALCVWAAPPQILLPILVIPILIAVWSWRSGTDASVDGLVVRAPLGSRRIPWSDVSELVPSPDGRVNAQLTTGEVVELPAVSAHHLPALVTLTREATAPREDGRVHILTRNRNDWRLAAFLFSVFLAFGLAVASGFVQRPVPMNVYSMDHYEVVERPAAGWPLPYFYDNQCCSVIGTLGLEDDFRSGPFLLDLAVFATVPVVVGVVLLLTRRRPVRL